MNRSLVYAVLFLLGIVAFTGCIDRSGRSPLGNVRGTVTLDGEPVAKARIGFFSSHSRMAAGDVEDGQIKNVTTYSPGDGAPVGEQIVTISVKMSKERASAIMQGKPLPEDDASNRLPKRYGSPTLSGLRVNIERGTNELSFDLTTEENDK